MTVQSTVLFTPEGKPTSGLLRLWVQQGGAQPLQVNATLLELDLSGTRLFRSLWQRAFPTRNTLPFGPLGTKDGLGTTNFWDVFS